VVLCCAQAQLLDSLFGTERGLSASSEVRAEINELITQLEAKSPTSDLSEVRFPPLMPLLSKCDGQTAGVLLCTGILSLNLYVNASDDSALTG
jgi:hypothetical protein